MGLVYDWMGAVPHCPKLRKEQKLNITTTAIIGSNATGEVITLYVQFSTTAESDHAYHSPHSMMEFIPPIFLVVITRGNEVPLHECKGWNE